MKTLRFHRWDCHIEVLQYDNKRPAIVLVAADTSRNRSQDVFPGEQIAKASVNLPDDEMGPDEVAIKSWGGQEDMIKCLGDAGLVTPTARKIPTGFVEASTVIINRAALLEYAPQ